MKYIRKTSENFTENFLNNLLIDRKIISNLSAEEKEKFFNPTIDNELSPSLLDNIQEAYQMLLTHCAAGGQIYVPIDPDVDGYTSAALFFNYMCDVVSDDFAFSLNYHVPEGKEHGLATIMDWFPEDGNGSLIVMLDSSSNDYEQHKILKERGYDIIVLDHHEAPHYSEDAIVVNNQLSNNYPNKNLSGVGVVFKFFEYWEEQQQYKENKIYNYIDLVALGLISDVMQMTTLENRFICDYGLSNIKNTFFRELIKKQCYSLFGIRDADFTDEYYTNGSMTQIKIAFYITPLINALIRVGNIDEKNNLFLSFITPDIEKPSTKRGEKGMMETVCTQTIRNCVNAKARQKKEQEKAAELLGIQIFNNNLEENKILILNADDIGVDTTLTGLCAMEVAAKYKKPVLLGRTTQDGKELRGSIRNFDTSPLKDFKEFLMSSGMMIYVAGHANAAGFSIPTSCLDKLTQFANSELKDYDFNEKYFDVDFVVNSNCSYLEDLIYDLERGSRFYGQGCPEPKVVIENIIIDTSKIQVMGARQDTMKFTINGITYIKFFAKDLIGQIKQQSGKLTMTVLGRPSVNVWMGRTNPQILIEEIEFKETSKYDF